MEEKFADYGEVQSDERVQRCTIHPGVTSSWLYNTDGERDSTAAQLMNNAGIMGAYEPQELKEELSKLNATCHVTADDDNLYITFRRSCQPDFDATE